MQQSDLNGILLMNKPQGFTSHDVVAKLRGILHTRRIGHGGTLDPMATGVLPVFVGGATKAADFAAAQDKEYVAGFTLGYCTDTQDVTGEMLQTSERYAAEYAVKQMVRRFIGPQQQVPPMYSAVKVNAFLQLVRYPQNQFLLPFILKNFFFLIKKPLLINRSRHSACVVHSLKS